MIKFEEVHTDVVKVLKKHNIKEEDLFNHYSDLYIGCKNAGDAHKIKEAGIWRAMSSVFIPQEGSEMDMYPRAVDIAFAYTGFLQRKFDKLKKA